MKTIYSIQGKRVTKKALVERFGAERVKKMTQEAKEGFMEDPYTEQSYFIGKDGVLTIEFA
ncbi:MAG: hypothetical protein LUE31_08370 [Lachnospiraceae bacterium]|nr:hypothetical protein [Lachnospiraceae bacterium]